MNSNTEITLTPVIELYPDSYRKGERQGPEKSYIEAPQEWIAYNQTCYKDSGLYKILPIEPLSWLFKIEMLSDEELKIILKHLMDDAVEDFDSINEILDDPIEYAPLISGGYVFEVNKVIKSRPICCCGLEDIIEWKDAQTIWTGHGKDDFVQIVKDNTQVEIIINKETFLLSREAYNQIIKNAEIQIDKFIERSGKWDEK